MDWPPLAILTTTYNRAAILEETLTALKERLYYVGRTQLIVADDGSTDGTQQMLAKFPGCLLVQSQRLGLGGNANAGLRQALAMAPVILQFQDDMKLLTGLDLHPHVELLLKDESCGFIRLWGVGGHHYTAQLEGNYWRVLWNSDELYIPSDRPHVKHRRFVEHFGFYPEGYKAAETEEAFCHQCKDRAGLNGRRLDVFVPQNANTETSWEHIGWHDRARDKGL